MWGGLGAVADQKRSKTVSYFPSERTRASGLSSGLLSKVFGLLAFSLAFAVVGGYVGAQLDRGWLLPLFILQIGMIFAVHGLRNREGWNLALLYGFTFVSGLTLGPVIAAYTSAGLGGLVLQAVAVTGFMTAGLGAYALTTKRDLSGLGPYLFMGLIGLIVASVVSIFVGGGVLYTVISWGGALLFSLLLVYDVQRAKYAEDTMGNAVVITLGIYLNIINLFMFVLRILGGSRN